MLIFYSNMNLFTQEINRARWDVWEYQHVFCFVNLIVHSLLFLVFILNWNSKRCWHRGANKDEQLRVINIEWLCDTSCILRFFVKVQERLVFHLGYSDMWETDWLPWELCFWEHFPYNKESCMGQSRGKLGRTRSAPDHLLCRWYKKAGLRKTMNMLKETMRKWDSREHQHVPCRNEETAHPLYFVVCLISALALEQN